MRLQEKTHLAEGRFSNLELSTGQRKRLALIISLLEDRPVCVFDEVGADQDPDFRRYYYQTILDRLRKQGKIVVVVSHEERSLKVADRVYRLNYGKLVASADNGNGNGGA